MTRKQAIFVFPIFIFSGFLAVIFWPRKYKRTTSQAYEQYNIIKLNSPATSALPLIPMIEHLQDLSLSATRNITGTDELAVSYTLHPTSNNKLNKIAVLNFHGLTIYDAFEKIATSYDLVMTYKFGRFILRDPDYRDMSDKTLFSEVIEP